MDWADGNHLGAVALVVWMLGIPMACGAMVAWDKQIEGPEAVGALLWPLFVIGGVGYVVALLVKERLTPKPEISHASKLEMAQKLHPENFR